MASIASLCFISLLLLLFFYCPISGQEESSKEIFERLFSEWVNGGYSESHDFVRLSKEKYFLNPHDAHANNLMGVLAYQNRDILSASKYFMTANELVGFNNHEFIANYVSSQNRINYLETLEVLVATLQKDVFNDVLYEEIFSSMVNLLHNHNLPHNIIVRIVKTCPTKYKMWMLLVDSVLRRSSPVQKSLDGVHYLSIPILQFGDSETDLSKDDKRTQVQLVTLGLSLFPRSPELLLLRSMLYHDNNDTKCAHEAYRAATAAMKFVSTNFSSVEHFVLFKHILSSSAELHETLTNSDHQLCLPFLSRHRQSEYQHVYNEISSVAGPRWSALANMSMDAKSTDAANQLVHESVSRAAAIDADGTTSATVFLPALQVGCSNYNRCARPGFLIADALESPSTHFVTLASNLSMVESASIGLLYSSHTLEHLSHNLPPASSCPQYPVSDRSVPGCASELDTALAEWRRVLAHQGRLLLSVPDLMALAGYFIRPGATPHAKAVLRNIFFGGQVNQFDVHKTGFYFEALQGQLESHGFCDIRQVRDFAIFRDASSTNFYFNESISLNVIANACR